MESAVLDACVLIPSALSDTLLRLAEAELYRPLWSVEILDEVRRNLPTRLNEVAIARRINAMRVHFPSAMVRGYEHLVRDMGCHPKDRHVLAVAVIANADLIVTANLKDFPPRATNPFGIEAVHPDSFLCDLLDRQPELIRSIIRQQSADTGRSGRPHIPVAGVLRALRASGVGVFASRLEDQV